MGKYDSLLRDDPIKATCALGRMAVGLRRTSVNPFDGISGAIDGFRYRDPVAHVGRILNVMNLACDSGKVQVDCASRFDTHRYGRW